MTFVRAALRDKPVRLWMLDDSGPLDDSSGYGVNANPSTTMKTSLAIVSGAKYSTVLNPTDNIQFPSPVMQKGREDDSFTLETWFRVTNPGTAQQVFSNTGTFDGLVVSGNIIQFITKYTGADDAVISYDIQQGRTVHIVAVHTASKNSLYINGVMVGEVSLTDAQQSASFAANSDGNLYMGGGSSQNQSFLANGVAIYSTALSQDAIMRHYLAGIEGRNGDEVASGFGGYRIPVSLSNSNLFLDQWWTSEEHWKMASLFNVAVQDGQLRPQFEGNTSVPGQWLDSFAIDAAERTSIFGVSANWDGAGFTIEVSLDGTTWETVQRGKNIGLIPAGFNPTNKELQIRVSFAGGIVNDPAFLDNLNFIGLKSAVSPVVFGRTTTFSNAYQEREYRPLELHENWGAEIGPGGSIVISADTLEATPVRTIEVWLRRNGSTVPTVAGDNPILSVYQNGVANNNTIPQSEWVIVHIITQADWVGPMTISGESQVGQVILYPAVLTAAQIAKIVGQYTDTDVLTVNDTSAWPVTQTSPAARVYAYDWSISSAG